MIRILTIPFNRKTELFEDDTLQSFLLNKSIIRVEPQFFQQGHQAYWTVLVEYDVQFDVVEDAINVDNLTEKQESLLGHLKEWRRNKAAETKVPVFIISTNRQLVDLVKKAPTTLQALKEINGFGKKKIEQHGNELIKIVGSLNVDNESQNTKIAVSQSASQPVSQSASQPVSQSASQKKKGNSCGKTTLSLFIGIKPWIGFYLPLKNFPKTPAFPLLPV